MLDKVACVRRLRSGLHAFSPLIPYARRRFALLRSATRQVLRCPAIPYGSYGCYVPYPCKLSVPTVLLRCGHYVGRNGIPRGDRSRGCHRTHHTFLVNCSHDIPHLHRTGHYANYNRYGPRYPRNVSVPTGLRRVSQFIRTLGRRALWQACLRP